MSQVVKKVVEGVKSLFPKKAGAVRVEKIVSQFREIQEELDESLEVLDQEVIHSTQAISKARQRFEEQKRYQEAQIAEAREAAASAQKLRGFLAQGLRDAA